MICPAMNPAMLAAPAVQRHLVTLREYGWEVLEPAEGHMACGDEGRGRPARAGRDPGADGGAGMALKRAARAPAGRGATRKPARQGSRERGRLHVLVTAGRPAST
jgi:hypothetical protein